MKGLHVADLHLDRPFEGIFYTHPRLEEAMQQNMDILLRNIENLAFEEDVDVVLISGDTFHQPQVSRSIKERWFRHLERLLDHQIQPVVIFGNHDYYQSAVYRNLPAGVIHWSDETVTTQYYQTKRHEKVALSGFSYTHSHIQQSKVNEFPPKDEQADYHIGLYHGQLSGEYAPFRLEEMKSKGYDYWALGHIHQYESLTDRIYYPGTPQGKMRKDFNQGNVILFTLYPEECYVTPVDIAPIHYEKLPLSLLQNAAVNWKYDGVELIDLVTGVSSGESSDINELVTEFNGSISGIATDKFIVKTIIETEEKIKLPQSLQKELRLHYEQPEIFMDLLSELLETGEYDFLRTDLLELRTEIIRQTLADFGRDLQGG